MHRFIALRRLGAVVCIITGLAAPALANHGPGASGGGSATISGETLKPGSYELTLREDYSQFQPFSFPQARQRERQGGDFDSLNHGFITTADFGYGVVEDLQVGAGIGYFIGHDFKSASPPDDRSVETS